ncbi:MAG: ATP phosphoribosyltransferase regulatory subunit, partial [Clostridiales bacterium]|nr:ATP phosphoribosyltransferase regulatory subunit [Clostridiales bacterium]
ELGVSEEHCKKILHFINFKGTNEETIAFLNGLKADNEIFDLGVEELDFVRTAIGSYGVPEENFHIDLTIARGLDYYTGTVYETSFNKHPEIGSICSGGRYENLAGYYTEKQLPGVGISIGLTRLFYILNEKEYLRTDTSAPSDVLVIPMTDDVTPSIQISNELRNANINTQIYFEKKKFKAKIGYADKLSIPFAIFLGEDELAQQKVALKNLTTGEQQVISLEEAITTIKQSLSEKGSTTIIDTELTSR